MADEPNCNTCCGQPTPPPSPPYEIPTYDPNLSISDFGDLGDVASEAIIAAGDENSPLYGIEPEVIEQLTEDIFGQPTYDDPYGEDVGDFVEPPPLKDMLTGLADVLPFQDEEEKNTFVSLFDEIADGVFAEAPVDENGNPAGGSSGGTPAPAGGGINGPAGLSVAYNLTMLFNVILSLMAGFSINLTIFLPIANLLAILALIKAGLQILTLFSATVAGIDVTVNLGLKQLLSLLNPLSALAFGGKADADVEVPPFPININLGFGFTSSGSGIGLGINASVFASLGISSSLGLSASASAALSGNISAEVAATIDETITPIGSAKLPASVSANPSASGAMTESVSFGSGQKARSPAELAEAEVDTDTKINVLLPEDRTFSLVPHTNTFQSLPAIIIGDKPMSGLRDALNRCLITENALTYLYRKIDFQYNVKKTLCELLLLNVGWSEKTPIDPTILELLSSNLEGVQLNTGLVLITMGGVEPTAPAITI